MSFFSRLENRVAEVDSLLCVGLDPHPGDLPARTGEAAKAFCLRLVEATLDLVAAYKPTAAFFEAFGPGGMAALGEVIAAIPEEVPVILDAKRGDIASTAQAYAQAAFQTLGADAMTINPYLGRDAVQPFIADPEKGVFLLCKTSNPGASDLQDLIVGERGGIPLYEQVAHLAQDWNRNDNLGLVVGATQPESLARVRAAAPDLWILAPGVGAQGGNLGAALRAGLRADGMGLLVPVSRGISRASDPREAATALRDAINQQRAEIWSEGANHQPPGSMPSGGEHPEQLARIADGLLETGCVRFGRFTLKSGQESPIYIDLRRLAGFPDLLSQVAAAYLPILEELTFDHLAALPYAALPIATAISLQSGWPMIYPRKEVKAYGTKAQIEGVFTPGERAVVIDDLVSTGGSKLEGIQKLTSVGLEVEDVVVLIDRRPAGQESDADQGYRLHAVFTLAELLAYWEGQVSVPDELIAETRVFLG
jgi:uridine monophosphate synthetase